MKSSWFGNRQRYDFARCLRDADYSWQNWDLFSSWLIMVSYTLRQPVQQLLHGKISAEHEERVLREQGRVPKWAKFAEALGILTVALHEEPYDFLGMLLMELGVNETKFRGQCFTPKEVTNCMAQMGMGDARPDDARSLLLSEPACGGGAMVIATSHVLRGNGFHPWHYHWQAVDIDWKCFAMTYIQCSLLGLPVTAHHGNTLTVETWDSATTLVGVLHPPRAAAAQPVKQQPVKQQPVKQQRQLPGI